jgi:hypothetical protein
VTACWGTGEMASGCRQHPGHPGANGDMESEPARALGLAANECAAPAVGFDCSALRIWRINPSGCGTRLGGARAAGTRVLRSPLMDGETAEVQSPARTRVGPQGLGRETSAIRAGKLKPPRVAVVLKANGRATAGERDLRLPLARSSPS